MWLDPWLSELMKERKKLRILEARKSMCSRYYLQRLKIELLSPWEEFTRRGCELWEHLPNESRYVPECKLTTFDERRDLIRPDVIITFYCKPRAANATPAEETKPSRGWVTAGLSF